MKTNPALVAVLFCLGALSASSGLANGEGQLEKSIAEEVTGNKAESDWIVYVEDGISEPHAVDLLPATTPMEHYAENLARISNQFSDPRAQEANCVVTGAYDPANITVTEIGPWYGYTVFDLANVPAKHRSIVLRDQQGNHRILYTQVCWGSATHDSSPKIIEVEGESILFYRSGTGGSSGNYTEYYFLHDSEIGRPVSLSLAPIKEKIEELILDKIVWDAGGFDIESLRYTNPVQKKYDGDCCPGAGQVTMKLEIREKALVVTEAKYDPE